MADWHVAAISAGAALVGVTVGGVIQLALQKRQLRAARLDSQRERRRTSYREFIHLVVHLPNLLLDATIQGPPDGHQLIREFGRTYDTLRAEMLLVGSKVVRERMTDVRLAVGAAIDEYAAESEANVAKPREERSGFDTILRRIFDDRVVPVLTELAEIMVRELDED